MHDRTVCQNAYCTFKINALYYMESYLIFKKTFKFKAKTKPNQQKQNMCATLIKGLYSKVNTSWKV